MKRTVFSLTLIALLFFLAACGEKKFSMPTANMEPTIPAGSFVLADMNAYQSETPQRFEIVVFHPPASASTAGSDQTKYIWCKRILGLPKEKIEINESGIYINDVAIDLPEGLRYTSQGLKTKINLGESEYFLLGDNSENSFDSRYWGPVHLSQILGKVTEIQPIAGGNE